MGSSAALDASPDWAEALTAVGLGEDATAPAPDLALFFASPVYSDLERLVREAYLRSAASVMIGCSGQGIIGPGREIEGEHALSICNLDLPGARLYPRHIETDDVAALATPADWQQWAGLTPDEVNAWIVLIDPYTFDAENLAQGLASAYPGAPIMGGLASGMSSNGTLLYLDGQVHESGAVIMAMGGAYTIQSVVAQGAAPIGEPWAITSVERNVLRTIGNRPALEVLRDTLNGLSEPMRRRASRNILVGLAMDEYRDSFEQGDFLIRNLMGVDQNTGAVAIGAMPQVGQTIQFQVRDADAADQDLTRKLEQARAQLDGIEPAGALLCTCNGRGVGLFGSPNHDAGKVAETLGEVPLAGFFCNGEIGPVGGRTFLHGFTASLALFVPKAVPALQSAEE